MPTDILIIAPAIALSAYITIATLSLLSKIHKEISRQQLFARIRPSSGEGTGEGITLVCRLDGNEERLRNLLTVEHPDYEVIAIADSLHDSESLQRTIERYRMAAVDSASSSSQHPTSIRHIYRSTHRCYRRLLLLDITVTSNSDPTEAALFIATYDHILPLPDGKTLRPKAIERLTTELSLHPKGSLLTISSALGTKIRLYPRSHWTRCDSSSRVVGGARRKELRLIEKLTNEEQRSPLTNYLIILIFSSIIVGSAALLTSGFAPSAMGIVAVTTVGIAAIAAVARSLLIEGKGYSVSYGEILSLFCVNLVRPIWKIQK